MPFLSPISCNFVRSLPKTGCTEAKTVGLLYASKMYESIRLDPECFTDIFALGRVGVAVSVRPKGNIARGIWWPCRSSGRHSPWVERPVALVRSFNKIKIHRHIIKSFWLLTNISKCFIQGVGSFQSNWIYKTIENNIWNTNNKALPS